MELGDRGEADPVVGEVQRRRPRTRVVGNIEGVADGRSVAPIDGVGNDGGDRAVDPLQLVVESRLSETSIGEQKGCCEGETGQGPLENSVLHVPTPLELPRRS